MPELDATTHDYTVRLSGDRAVTANYYVLVNQAVLDGFGTDESPEALARIAGALRGIVTFEPADAQVTDAEVLACLQFILEAWEKAGNAVGPQPDSLRPTPDTSHALRA